MRLAHIYWLTLLFSTSLFASDPAYEVEFQRAIKLNPPGDYNERPLARFSPVTSVVKAKKAPTVDLLEPVQAPDKDIEALLSEAAKYFTIGRFDLAAVRYKQILLLDPGNKGAKAHLYDILVLQLLWADESRRSEATNRHAEMSEQISKDILLRKQTK